MGNHRRKKSNTNNNNTNNHGKSHSNCKPDEIAVSSMSSESTQSDTGGRMMMSSVKHMSSTNIKTTICHDTKSKISVSSSSSLFVPERNDSKLTKDDTDMDDDHHHDDTSGKTFRFTWNEMLALLMILVSFAICSIIVGVAAGISISIHYYESPDNVDHRKYITMNSYEYYKYGVAVQPQTITRLDPTIAAFSNNFHHQQQHQMTESLIPSQRMIHTSPTGVRSVVSIVEESPILVSYDGQQQHNVSSSSYTNWTNSYTYDDGATNTNNNNNDWNYNIKQNDIYIPPPHYGIGMDDWLRHPPKVCNQPLKKYHHTNDRRHYHHDTIVMGYDSYYTLQQAIMDANRYSAQKFDRWMTYYVSLEQQKQHLRQPNNPQYAKSIDTITDYSFLKHGDIPTFDDGNLYYEEPIVFTICPGTKLRANSMPLFINTEGVTIECTDCTISGGVSHISFGPEAKGALIRGITFEKSSFSSVLLYHHGADVTFEDCKWMISEKHRRRMNRYGQRRPIITGLNSIVLVNSSSTMNFYRCLSDQPTGEFRLHERISRIFNLQ